MELDPASRFPTVIVLASGRGERFRAAGGTGSKLQAALGASTVLGHTLAAVRASGLPWHLEDAGHPGMGDSIAAAVRATADAAGWLILPGDLPLVRPATLSAVARALAAPVRAAQPHYRGERGHPVGFAADCREALAALGGNQGAAPVLRALREAGAVAQVEVDDIGIVTDIDTPEALARAELLLKARLSAA
ncbi:molybdenum hydroxylase accessory protein, YgfJ family [Variovorax sp. SRS16]|uniref:nucleotidyltransferase family protein n=1 Tax=Variovorax sp. SRS16 TaxID=282217 RepID=UPI0013199B11|nr:NTP transferase domain-containing protein [Variovorax sp. SRS16]VTU24532.1 molybdenum hydroxylase accessory protein, YgfJ family [Variovorax sp. SRS16]